MKKFAFKLESVMNFKNQNLENKKAEHAQAIAKVNAQNDRINFMLQKFSDVNEDFNLKKTTGISVREALEYSGYLYKLEVEIQNERKILAQLQKIEEEKRSEVVKMKIETSTLEKLKEKNLAQYQKEAQKKEELFIEEFVSRSLHT